MLPALDEGQLFYFVLSHVAYTQERVGTVPTLTTQESLLPV